MLIQQRAERLKDSIYHCQRLMRQRFFDKGLERRQLVCPVRAERERVSFFLLNFEPVERRVRIRAYAERTASKLLALQLKRS